MSDSDELFKPEDIQKSIADFNTKYAGITKVQNRLDEIELLAADLETEFMQLVSQKESMRKDMEIEARGIFGMIVEYMKMPQFRPDTDYGGIYSQTLNILKEMKRKR